MRKSLLVLMIVFASSSAWAQAPPDKTADKKFIFASAFLVGATVFDAESTFAALNKCANCIEGNPIMRPLINSGRPATYAVEGAADVGLIAWSYKLKKDGNKLWWLPPVVVGAVHGLAGGFNLRFVF